MPAEGKQNAANLEVGQHILITRDPHGKADPGDEKGAGKPWHPSKVKRHVRSARVEHIAALQVQGTGRRARRVYVITTDSGEIRAAPIETFWLNGRS